MPSVLLCTDEPILAEGLVQTLRKTGELELVAWCSRPDDLQDQLTRYAPNLLLMDLNADVHFGLLTRIQGAATQTKIVLWVRSIAGELALQAMSLGIRGVLRKTLPPETLLRCLTQVHEGELWFEKALTDSLTSARRHTLTPREGQLVSLLSQGLKNKEIATAMELSEGSVKVYLSRLFHKLGVKDRLELALFGLKNLNSGISPAGTDRVPAAPPWQAPRSFFVDKVQTARMARP